MKKTRYLISICSSVFAILWGSMPARAQVPPPSDPVVVMIYCPHCGWVDVEKGETHRADCPSRGSVSASGGSSSRSSSSVDPALSAAMSQVGQALGEALVAGFDAGMDRYAQSSMVTYAGTRPGDTWRNFTVGRNGRHGRVGLFDNASRWWKIGPVYKDLKIYNPASVIAVNHKGKVGVLDATGKKVTRVIPFDHDTYQSIGTTTSDGRPIYAVGYYVGDEKKPSEKEKLLNSKWEIWKGNERLIVDEFDKVQLLPDGIIAEAGDRYMEYDLDGHLRMIVVKRK